MSEFRRTINENLHRPPNRRMGLMGLAAIIPAAAFAIFFISSSNVEDDLGSYATWAMPLFFASIIIAQALAAIGDLQDPADIELTIKLRKACNVFRALSFIAFGISVFGLIFVG